MKLNESSELKFEVLNLNSKYYGNIRKFVKTKHYTGPTKQGITISKKNISLTIAALKSVGYLNDNPKEEEIASINVTEVKTLKISCRNFKEKWYFDIRYFLNTKRYSGPTKKGISVPVMLYDNLIKNLNSLENELNNFPKDTLFNNITEDNNKPQTNNFELDTNNDDEDEIYPWEDVLKCREVKKSSFTGDILEQALDNLKGQNIKCPKCSKQINDLDVFYFESPKETWEGLCGSAGWMVICNSCKKQVYYEAERMS